MTHKLAKCYLNWRNDTTVGRNQSLQRLVFLDLVEVVSQSWPSLKRRKSSGGRGMRTGWWFFFAKRDRRIMDICLKNLKIIWKLEEIIWTNVDYQPFTFLSDCPHESHHSLICYHPGTEIVLMLLNNFWGYENVCICAIVKQCRSKSIVNQWNQFTLYL